jgi:hypothetical protein
MSYLWKFCCLMYEGFVVPVVKVLLSHFVQYFLLLSSTFSVVDNILFQPCLWSFLWRIVHRSI